MLYFPQKGMQKRIVHFFFLGIKQIREITYIRFYFLSLFSLFFPPFCIFPNQKLTVKKVELQEIVGPILRINRFYDIFLVHVTFLSASSFFNFDMVFTS